MAFSKAISDFFRLLLLLQKLKRCQNDVYCAKSILKTAKLDDLKLLYSKHNKVRDVTKIMKLKHFSSMMIVPEEGQTD